MSCPVWDVRRCHPLYVRRLRGEVGAVFAVAGLLMLSTGGMVLGLGFMGIGVLTDPAIMQGYAGLAVAVNGSFWTSAMLFVLVIALGVLWFRLRQHPNGAMAYGAAERRRVRRSVWSLGIGTIVASVSLHFRVLGPIEVAIVPASIGLGMAFFSALVLCRAGFKHMRGTLERCGVGAPVMSVEWPATLLTLAGLVPLVFMAIGMLAWPLAIAPSLVGVSLLAGGLAAQSQSAVRVLREFEVEAR